MLKLVDFSGVSGAPPLSTAAGLVEGITPLVIRSHSVRLEFSGYVEGVLLTGSGGAETGVEAPRAPSGCR